MALQTKNLAANGAKGHHKFTLTVTENSTSAAGNTSALSWALVLSPIVKNYDWVSNSGKVKYSVTIDGNTYSGIIATYDGVSTVTIKSGTLSCAHNADGAKTISCSFSITDSTGWSFAPGNASANGTMALTNIPRQANIAAAPNFNDEQNPTITYSNPAGAVVDSLDLCISLDETITNALAYKPVDETGTSFTYELSDEDRDYLQNASPNSNTLEVCFCLRTVIGETEYFSKVWRTLTIVNADPILDPTITDIDEDIVSLTGGAAMVRYFSDAYFRIGASAQKGATITSQGVTCGGVTVEGAEGSIGDIQSGDVIFTVTDSRGNTTTLLVQVPFVEYVAPTCSIGSGKPDTDGSFTLTASGVCYNGDITGAGPNVLNVYYRYKVSGGSYGDWMEMTVIPGETTYAATVNITGLDYRKTYTFQCKAVDRVTTATTDEVAVKSVPVFDWGEEDFNFNVPVAAPSIDVSGPASIGGPISIGGIQIDYIVEQGASGDWNYRKWASGIAECWARKSITTDVASAWGSLYTSGLVEETNLKYPFAFVAPPSLIVSLTTQSVGAILMVPGGGAITESNTQTGIYEIARGAAAADATYVLNYHAKGFWK